MCPEDDRPEPPPDGSSVDARISEADFAEWLKQPGHVDEFVGWLRTIDVNAAKSLPEPARAAIKASIAKWQEQAAIDAAQAKLHALMEVLRSPSPPGGAAERLRKCNALFDEIVDALLEAPEPHRTKLLEVIVPIRDEVRAIRADP